MCLSTTRMRLSYWSYIRLPPHFQHPHPSDALRANSRLHLLHRAAPFLSPDTERPCTKDSSSTFPLFRWAPCTLQTNNVQRHARYIISELVQLPSLALRIYISFITSICPHHFVAFTRCKLYGTQPLLHVFPQLR